MTDIYLPGAASIIEQIDTRLLIILRDGRNLIGTLRSFDQYMNLVLENTVERHYFEGMNIKMKFIMIDIIENFGIFERCLRGAAGWSFSSTRR